MLKPFVDYFCLFVCDFRRKDCLRQFIVILCERSQLQALVEFPYVDLHDDVVNIIESRSRSVDLATHNYYELLYSFHIFRGNFRKGELEYTQNLLNPYAAGG